METIEEITAERNQLKEMLWPLIEWGQDEGFTQGLKVGESITKEVLRRAKEYKQLQDAIVEYRQLLSDVLGSYSDYLNKVTTLAKQT